MLFNVKYTCMKEVRTVNDKVYEYESVIYEAGQKGGAYIIGIRKDIRAQIGKQPGDRVFVTVNCS